jgi:hypothetical protein
MGKDSQAVFLNFTKMWKCDDNNLHKKPTKSSSKSQVLLPLASKKINNCVCGIECGMMFKCR